MAVDAKLARGLARQQARTWDAAARLVRSSNYRLGERLIVDVGARRKISDGAFNVELLAHRRRLTDMSATPDVAFERATMGRDGCFSCQSLLRRDVVHLRGVGHFPAQDWTLARDRLWLSHGRPCAEFFTPPFIVDQHLVDRWCERAPLPAAALPGVLSASLRMALLHLAAVEAAPHMRIIDIVLPAPGGVFLGGIEVVGARQVGDGMRVGWKKERGMLRRSLALCPSISPDIQVVVSLRTYMDEALCDADVYRHARAISAWELSSIAARMEDPGLPVSCMHWNEGIAEAFRPVMERTQDICRTWRDRLATQGCAYLDFAALQETWRAHSSHPNGHDCSDAARIAAIACLPAAQVSLGRRPPEKIPAYPVAA